MLRRCVLAAYALCFSAAYYTPEYETQHGSNVDMNITDLIASNGYPVKDYKVETSDGYILDLIRIPYGTKDQQAREDPQRQGYEEEEYSGNRRQSGMQRPAVLLMHGMLSSSEEFVLGGPTQGLAYILADNGLDVFMGNVRGSTYGKKHSVLDPERDPAFWKFCWHEMGVKDLPAIVDKILDITRQQEMYYMGHMQGSTIFYVMTSEMPQYNKKFKAMVALQPMVFLEHSRNIMMQIISENQQSPGWVVKNLGANEFKPSKEFIKVGGEVDCFSKYANEKICSNPFFLINGYNSRYLNTTTAVQFLDRQPSSASTRQILHYGQLVKTGKFTKYCPTYTQCEEYQLEMVTTPTVFVYTLEDPNVTPVDVEKLSRKLPNIRNMLQLTDYTNNIDLIYGKSIGNMYQSLVKMLRNLDRESAEENH